MTSSWLPTWLGLAWTAAFVVVLAVHAWHVVALSGRARLWHSTHVLMAAGMIVMYLPADRPAGTDVAGVLVFTAAALVVAILLLRGWARGGRPGSLWLVVVVDLAAMAFMVAPDGATWPGVALAAWFAVQAAGWASGRLCRELATGGLGTAPEAARRTVTVGSAAAVSPLLVRPVDAGAHHLAVHGTALRVTLTLMALGMAYMLLAMQFGMADMVGMSGMAGM